MKRKIEYAVSTLTEFEQNKVTNSAAIQRSLNSSRHCRAVSFRVQPTIDS